MECPDHSDPRTKLDGNRCANCENKDCCIYILITNINDVEQRLSDALQEFT